MKHNSLEKNRALFSVKPLRPRYPTLNSPHFRFWRHTLGLILILTLLLPQPAQGQASPITASVNKTAVATDELVVLTVTVTDNSAQQPRPLLPRLEGLAVVDLDIATDVDLVNGQIHTEVVYTYRLQPRRTGSLTIPPVAVKIDDQTYKTSPISIKVTQGAAPIPSRGNAITPDNVSPPANIRGEDFYIEAVVDLPTPFIGQQLIYTFRFYQALQIYREPQYEQPLFIEFETMGLPVQEYNLDAAGRTYLVTEIRTALFPKSVGTIIIGPARLMLPGNIYEEPIELYTEPLQVEVKPLPDDAPASFNGAVGQYDIKSWFSPEVAVVNQPSTLFVAVSGIGNVRDLPELIWPDLDGWQSYNSLTSLTTAMESNVMTGTRVYERVMVPGQIGEFLIPAINFIYFDPIAVEYRTISTEMLTVKVIPAPTPDPVTSGSVPAAIPRPTVAVDTPPPAAGAGLSAWRNLWNLGRSLVTSVGAILLIGVCGVLPAMVAIGFGGNWLWQRRHSFLDRVKAKPKPEVEEKTLQAEALQKPRQSIHPTLVVAMQNNSDNYKSVSQALNIYLGEVLHTSVNGLTRTELATRLRQRDLDGALIKRIEDCLAKSEMGRYGPVTDDVGWSLMVEADALLFDLDQAFGIEAQ